MTEPSIFLIPTFLTIAAHAENKESAGLAISSLAPIVGSPPPMMYRSPCRTPFLISPAYPIRVAKRYEAPSRLKARPVVTSLVFDAGTNLRKGLYETMVSPTVVMARTPTCADRKGSVIMTESKYAWRPPDTDCGLPSVTRISPILSFGESTATALGARLSANAKNIANEKKDLIAIILCKFRIRPHFLQILPP